MIPIAFESKRNILFRFRYFVHGEALALSQRVVGLYILALQPSSIKLNSFARRALSQLPVVHDVDLYEEFLDAWGTHIITASLVAGMVEERASVRRCFIATSKDAFERCIPFSSRSQTSPACGYYASQARVTSKRRLGGNVQAENDNKWKRTLAVAPALLQILAMIPWYEFVTNERVKQNLRVSIQCRLRNVDTRQAEAVRLVNAYLPPCFSGNIISAICFVFVSVIVQSDTKQGLRCLIGVNWLEKFSFRHSSQKVQ